MSNQVVVLAGDSVAVRSILMGLQMEGFEPVRITNGDELLKKLGGSPPVGVLIDLSAPWPALTTLIKRVRATGQGKKYRLGLFGERPGQANAAAIASLALEDEDFYPLPVEMPRLVARIRTAPDAAPGLPKGAPPSTASSSTASSSTASSSTASSSTAAPAAAPGATAGSAQSILSPPTSPAVSTPGPAAPAQSAGPRVAARGGASPAFTPPPFPSALAGLLTHRQSGELHVQSEAHGAATFLFREGLLYQVRATSGSFTPVEQLALTGRISAAQKAALTRQGISSLDALIPSGIVAAHELLDIQRALAERALQAFLSDLSTQATFHSNPQATEGLFNPGIELFRRLVDAYKQAHGATLFPPLKDLSVALEPTEREKIQTFNPLAYELRAINQLNGSKTVSAVIEGLSNANADRARDLTGFLNALAALGFIQVKVPPEPPKAESPPTDWGARKVEVETELERLKKAQKAGDFMAVLGLDAKASPADAKTKYFALSKIYHPDRAYDAPPEVRALMEELFRLIGEAYEQASDPKKREAAQAARQQAEGIDVRTVLQAEIAFNQGNLFLKNNNPARARAHFEDAIKGNNAMPEYKVYLGWAMFLEDPGKFAECAKMIHDAIKASPNMDKAYYFLGCIFKAKGELAQAENAFKKAVGLNANNIEAQRELRLFQMRREKTEQESGKKGGLFGLFKK